MSFSEKTIQFLIENKIENSRDWFTAHKADYLRFVVQPLAEFVTALTPPMLEIDPMFDCEPKINRAISHIYRDTRFSKDKTIFRDVVWCLFIRDKKLFHNLPGFFFELSPRGFRYGCGFYIAEPATMANIRQFVLTNNPFFEKAKEAFDRQKIFNLDGDCYKKTRFPDQSEELRKWLDLKDICFICDNIDFDLLYSEELSKKVADDLKILTPEYRFLLLASISGTVE
ncbi:MAG TPA: DUF2461 domain-containing protein [Oscillospiraceae bacterium]|nr:DUF2461 domain-containing protein [Oscillospiraceae bacterium]HPS34652.1 DUF2461 domain-containing protein [Oscillospiraceae bacterium]